MSRALAWFALAAVLTAPLGFGQATYTFDEGGGTTARDSSGTGLGGSIAGATYVSGYRGTALHFRGGTDRVTVPERVFSAFRNTAYFEAWIRPASQARMCCANPESGVIVFAKRAGYNDWAMELMRDGSLRATLYNAAGSDAVVARSKAGAIPLNTWTKVAMWYDGASMRLLVNDLETARTDKAFALDWSRDYITTEIGNDTYDIGSPCGDCDRAFVGDIDEVVISPAPPASEAKRGGWSELFPRNAPPARLWHAMAFDGAKIVLFGGFHAPVDVNNTWEFKIFDDTWTWDGVDWAEASVATRPPARFRHAMAYDEARRQVVLFGGYDNSFMNDTWVWDGRTWTKKTPANSPSPRGWHAMAYDAARRQVVLFGGTNDAFTHGLNDTWVWDGTNWQRKSVSVQPQAQFAHAMAYDPVRSRVVLIGREGDLPDDPKTALWTWDGQAWTRYAGASVKPARAGLAAAFDGPRSQVLIYGGGSMVREDTTDVWAWDGAALNQLPAATTPGGRGAVMAYDAVRRQVVFFGGDPWERGLDDTWIWADAASLGKPSIVSFSPMSLPPGGELTVTGAGFSEERPWSKYPSNKVTLRLGDVEYPAPVTAVAPGRLTAFIPPVIRDGSNQWYRGPVQVCVSVDGQQTCAPDRLNIEPAAVPDAPPGRTLLDFSRKANQSGVDVLIRAGLAADAAEVQSVARAFDQQLSELVNAAVEGRPQLIRVPDGSGQMVDVPFELSAIRAVESLLVAYEKSRTAAAQSEHAAEGLARNRPAADCPLTDEQRRMEAKTAKDQLELTGGVLAVAGLAASVTGAVAACGTVVACPAALVAMQVAVPILITAAEWGVFAAEMNLQTRGSNLLVKVNPPDHVRLQTGAAASVALTAEFGNLTGPENRYEWVRKICTEFVSKVVTWGFSELVPKEFLHRVARPAVGWIIGKTSDMLFEKALSIARNAERDTRTVELGARTLRILPADTDAYVRVTPACAASGNTRTNITGLAPTGLGPDSFAVVASSKLIRLNDDGPTPATRLYVMVEDAPPSLASLSFAQSSLTGGAGTTGTVTLSRAAGPAGVAVSLRASSTLVTVPSSVAIQAGRTSGTFTLTSAAVSASQSVVVTATLNGRSVTASVNIVPGGPATGRLGGTVRNAANAAVISGVLVAVNGTSLSARTGSDGSYSISNVPAGRQTIAVSATGYISTQLTVEVTAGATTVQNISLSPVLQDRELRITLNWTKDSASRPDDLDLHLIGPLASGGCFEVYFDNQGSLTGPPYAQLEVDNIEADGHPPTETIRVARLVPGVYRLYVNDYEAELSNGLAQSRATVQVYSGSSLARTVSVPAGAGDWWSVLTIDGSSGNVTVTNLLNPTLNQTCR